MSIGGQTISSYKLSVLEGSGIIQVLTRNEKSTLEASKIRVVKDKLLKSKLVAGELTLDLINLRSLVYSGF